jgi:hypothetical protein
MGSPTQPPSTTQQEQQPGHASSVTSPRLSSTQKAYREDPDGFLQRLQARAQSLFHDGYTVRPGNEPHQFRVAHTNPKDGLVSEYVVHAGHQRCTCPFFARQASSGERLAENGPLVPCKHLLGLPALVRDTWRKHARDGNAQALTDLWRHWMVFVAHRRRKRQEAEWTERRRWQREEQMRTRQACRTAARATAVTTTKGEEQQ